MPYDVVPYTPEFDTQIASLRRLLGNSDPAANAAYMKWKYADNPILDDKLIYVALYDGRVVGMRGMFGTLWQVDDDDSRHVLPYADDLVIDPAHRNRGVVSQIMKCAIDDLARRGFPFAINLSAGPVTYVASLALGWRAAGSLEPVCRTGQQQPPRFTLPRRIERMISVRRARALFRNLESGGDSERGGISVSRSPRIEAMAELVARLPWDGRIRQVRDARFFAWRFRNPLHEYRFLYTGGERLQGYLVLQRYVSDLVDLERVNIVDWEAANEQVRADLLAAALRWGGFRRVHAWMATASDSGRSLLQAHGFDVDPDRVRVRHQGILVRRVQEGTDATAWRLGSRDLLSIADWDMRMLYSMAG